jgi:hypothetical protein
MEIFVKNLSFFLYSSKYDIFSSKIPTVPSKCLYVCGYLILEKIESKKVIFKNLLMC